MFYAAIDDPYLYPGTKTLVNLFDIRDENRLAALESDLVIPLEEILRTNPTKGKFDLEHLCQIHRVLFGDLYPWAGEIRAVRIAKGGSMFAYPEHIERAAGELFENLRHERYLQNLAIDEFAERLAWHMAEINAIHPFREGNGRASRVFFARLAEAAGYEMHLERIDREKFMRAMIASFTGDCVPLAKILRKSLSPLM